MESLAVNYRDLKFRFGKNKLIHALITASVYAKLCRGRGPHLFYGPVFLFQRTTREHMHHYENSRIVSTDGYTVTLFADREIYKFIF